MIFIDMNNIIRTKTKQNKSQDIYKNVIMKIALEKKMAKPNDHIDIVNCKLVN